MPPRRTRPMKALQAEQPSSLSRLARLATDWKAIVTAVLLLFGGIAYALKIQFATKGELEAAVAPLAAHDAKNDQERAAVMRAMQDFKENQDRLMQWVWDIHQKK